MKSLFKRADHISSDLFEEFKSIPGFEDYEISQDGIIRRKFKDGHYHYLSPYDNGYGYKLVALSKYGKTYARSVDRLISSTFINDDLYQSEEFKTIPGFEDYEISTNGVVRRWFEGGYHYISPFDVSSGYQQVDLCKDGKEHRRYIHRLVAITFIPNDDPENKTDVNHINEIKSDNRLENLEWVTKIYNNNYGTRNERISQTRRNRNKTNFQNPKNSDETA